MKKRNSVLYKNNNGFTLVELIVVMVILAIVVTLSALGMIAWQDWATFKQENEYAQTLFIAAQNQLSEYSTNGRLKEMQESLGFNVDGTRKTGAPGLTIPAREDSGLGKYYPIISPEGNYYLLDEVWPESANKPPAEVNRYRDTLVSLRAEKGEYETYLNNPAAFKASDPESYWVFELLGAYVYDTSILNNGTICVEITPEDGQVFSVLYSDKNGRFIYKNLESKAEGNVNGISVADIEDRQEEYRQERMIGYYGVDTLYKATRDQGLQEDVTLVNAHLNNEETLNLEFVVEEGDYSKLHYQVNIISNASGRDLLSLTIDGGSLKNATVSEAEKIQSVPVTRYSYAEDGTKTTTNLGNFNVLCWTEGSSLEKPLIRVVLDAADIQAQTKLYEEELAKIRSTESNMAASAQFAKTYSFFRFGVDPEVVYCNVTASGVGYKTSETVRTVENEHTVYQTGIAKTATDFEYTLTNARHFYNMRYLEDVAYDKQLCSGVVVTSTKFIVNDEIAWDLFCKGIGSQNGRALLNKEYNRLYDSYANTNYVDISKILIDGVATTLETCPFPSINQLQVNDEFTGNGTITGGNGSFAHTVSGLRISSDANVRYGIYNLENNKIADNNNRPTGFVNVNYGTIDHLQLDKIKVNGSNFVGGFVGINAGTVDYLTTLNTASESKIVGIKNVGGILGFQVPLADNQVISNLTNRAAVEGTQAVGGILGMVRNEFDSLGIDWSQLGFDMVNNYLENTEVTGKVWAEINEITFPNGYGFPFRNPYIVVIVHNDTNAVVSDWYVKLNSVDYKWYEIKVNNPDGKLNLNAGTITPTSSECVDIQPNGTVQFSFRVNATTITHDAENKLIAANNHNNPMIVIGNKIVPNTRRKYSVTIENCENYGLVRGVEKPTGYTDNLEVRYIGGITGYSYNIYMDDTESITIRNCNSSPQYSFAAELTKEQIESYLKGTYVGGIVGYNHYGQIENCSSRSENGKNGYILGDTYVGGIVGMNIGPISGIQGGNATTKGVNENNIIARNYAGGITGCNANVLFEDSEGNILDNRDPAKLVGILLPNTARSFDVRVDNWVNKGIVVATENYAGGITGYNAGWIYRCNSEVSKRQANTMFTTLICGDYAGGISGYNNGIIGNSARDFSDNTSTVKTYGSKFSTVCYVRGNNYIGGIVGYNDVDAIVEDYTVTGGYVIGEEGSCFVGGYAGFNASIDLLMDMEKKLAREIVSSPNEVNGSYFVGGVVGGNIINTKGYISTTDNDEPSGSTEPTKTDIQKVYGSYTSSVDSSISQGNGNGNNGGKNQALEGDITYTIYNNSEKEIINWYLTIEEIKDNGKNATVTTPSGYAWDKSKNILSPTGVTKTIKPGETVSVTIHVICNNSNQYNRLKNPSQKWTVHFADQEPSGNPDVDPGNNIVPLKGNIIEAKFQTDNFAGALTAEEFAGGFVGYNLLIDSENAECVKAISEQIVSNINANNSASDNLYKNADFLDHLHERISDSLTTKGVNYNSSDVTLHMTGVNNGTRNSLSAITAEIYVGGVMGYNDDNCKLYVQNVQNATPVIATSSIGNPSEQLINVNGSLIPRSKNYAGDPYSYRYSYAGGVIGRVSEHTIIDNCKNVSLGTVTSAGTYLGGICEVNAGMVINCTVKSIGNSTREYVGGICGLNESTGTVSSCNIENQTVTAKNMAGIVASENFGVIDDITITGPRIVVAGKAVSRDGIYTKDGAAGVYAAYNGPTGEIRIDQDLLSVNITSGGQYVGVVTGINEGKLVNEKTTSDARNGFTDNILISGSVNAYQTAGGVIGWNNSSDTASVVNNFTNTATIITSYGEAGGIIGLNSSNNTIRYCANDALVNASNGGNAGGITSINHSTIENCVNYRAISAPMGKCGGITAINGSVDKTFEENTSAYIHNCYVGPKSGTNSEIVFVSSQANGGVAAQNSGVIENNRLVNITVTNDSNSPKMNLGVVVGENYATGRIWLAGGSQSISNCKAIAKVNDCNVGGIAGLNEGVIANKDSFEKWINEVSFTESGNSYALINSDIALSGANRGNLGGVAGANNGIIAYCQVDADIEGDMSISNTGYGGIAGFSGYITADKANSERNNKNDIYKNYITDSNKNVTWEYPAIITHASFDGIVHANGASGMIARIGGIVGINGYGALVEHSAIGVRESSTGSLGSTVIAAGNYQNAITVQDNVSFSRTGGIAGENYGYITDIDLQAAVKDTIEVVIFKGSVGGIVGWNKEGATVTGYYAGENAFAYDKNKTDIYGVTTDSQIRWITSSDKMTIKIRNFVNDQGPSGIIGYNESGKPLSFIKNFARILTPAANNKLVAGNVKAGGIVASYFQTEAPRSVFNYCYNYGYVESAHDAGGIIGRLKVRSTELNHCINFGEIYSNYASGGLIGASNEAIGDFYYTSCANYGYIHGSATQYLGGLFGRNDDYDAGITYTRYFYDCISAGIISRDDGALDTKVGAFVGVGGKNNVYDFTLCRNYNTSGSTNGFLGSGGSATYIKDCFDNSGAQTKNTTYAPFAGSITSMNNSYYIGANSIMYTPDIKEQDNQIYFGIHMGNGTAWYYNGTSYNSIQDSSIFLSKPDNNIYITAGGNKPFLDITVDATGTNEIGNLVVYLWNGRSIINDSGQSFYVTCNPILIYKDGTSRRLSPVMGQAKADLSGKISIDLNGYWTNENNSELTMIRLGFDGTNNGNVIDGVKVNNGLDYNIALHGFSYTLSGDASGQEYVCTSLKEMYGTSFTTVYQKQNNNNETSVDGFTNVDSTKDLTYINWGMAEYGQTYAFGYSNTQNDIFTLNTLYTETADNKTNAWGRAGRQAFYFESGDRVKISNTDAGYSRMVRMNFNVNSTEASPGIDKFVFYLGCNSYEPNKSSNAVSLKDFTYIYRVILVTKDNTVEILQNNPEVSYSLNGEIHNTWKQVTVSEQGTYDEIVSSCRQEIQIPEAYQDNIARIIIDVRQIEDSSGNRGKLIYIHGFGWVAKNGDGEEHRLGVTQYRNSSVNIEDLKNIEPTNLNFNQPIKLLVDTNYQLGNAGEYNTTFNQGQQISEHTPYVSLAGDHKDGFFMTYPSNVPNGIYGDRSAYNESSSVKDVLAFTTPYNGNTRIDVYRDIDPKIVSYILSKYNVNSKLIMSDIAYVEEGGIYKFYWAPVTNAIGYEVYYDVTYNDGTTEQSEHIQIGTNAFVKTNNLPYTGKIVYSMPMNSDYKNLVLHVRAISSIEEYSSDYKDCEVLIKEVLPEPEIRLETTAENRMVAVLLNPEDYLDENGKYLDCYINVTVGSASTFKTNANANDKNTFTIPISTGQFYSNEARYSADGATTKIKIEGQAIPNTENTKYTSSYKNFVNVQYISNAQLASRDIYIHNNTTDRSKTYFVGFVGDKIDEMSYQIFVRDQQNDAFTGYLMCDITAYDEELGMDVSYSVVEDIAGDSGEAKFLINIPNLPSSWFGADSPDKIVVRDIVYAGHYGATTYGHMVAENIVVNSVDDVKNIKDPYHFLPNGGDVTSTGGTLVNEYCVWDENTNELKPGYILQKNQDGTYNIYYSAALELSINAANQKDDGRPYYRYMVDAMTYTKVDNNQDSSFEYAMNTEDYQYGYIRQRSCGDQIAAAAKYESTQTTRYDNNNTASGSQLYVQQVQPEPIIEEIVESVVNGETVYTISWDCYFRDLDGWTQQTANKSTNYYYSVDTQLFDETYGGVNGEWLTATWKQFAEKTGYYTDANLSATDKLRIMNAYNYTYAQDEGPYSVNKNNNTSPSEYNYDSEPRYYVEILGISGASEIVLASEIVGQATLLATNENNENGRNYQIYQYQCNFTEQEAWANYAQKKIRITRLGNGYSITFGQGYKSGFNPATNKNTDKFDGGVTGITSYQGQVKYSTTEIYENTFRLPNYIEEDFVSMRRLDTIDQPGATLAYDTNGIITTSASYDITWNLIDTNKQDQLDDLGGYLITVASDNQTKYYYVVDVAAGKEINLDDLGLSSTPIQITNSENGENGQSGGWKDAEHNTGKVCINMSDAGFVSGETVHVMVKAVAVKNPDNFVSGNDSIELTFDIASMLAVPKQQDSVIGVGDITVSSNLIAVNAGEIVNGLTNAIFTADGIYLTYADSDQYGAILTASKDYQIMAAIAVFDPESAVTNELAADQSKIANNGDLPADSQDAGYWNTGAYAQISTKATPICIYDSENGTVLHLTKEQLIPYAGMYLKIALKTTSIDYIDSVWSDEDTADATCNYLWIYVPKMQLEPINVTFDNQTDGDVLDVIYEADARVDNYKVVVTLDDGNTDPDAAPLEVVFNLKNNYADNNDDWVLETTSGQVIITQDENDSSIYKISGIVSGSWKLDDDGNGNKQIHLVLSVQETDENGTDDLSDDVIYSIVSVQISQELGANAKYYEINSAETFQAPVPGINGQNDLPSPILFGHYGAGMFEPWAENNLSNNGNDEDDENSGENGNSEGNNESNSNSNNGLDDADLPLPQNDPTDDDNE